MHPDENLNWLTVKEVALGLVRRVASVKLQRLKAFWFLKM